MNLVMISGRLTRDCELKYVGVNNIPKLQFSMAVERAYQKDKDNKVVDYIDFELLGARAESLAPYLVKGKALLVNGELNVYKYTSDKGENRVSTKVSVNTLEFIGGGKPVVNEDGVDNKPVANNSTQPVVNSTEIDTNGLGFEAIDDEDIPF